MCRPGEPGSSWSRNQRRLCAIRKGDEAFPGPLRCFRLRGQGRRLGKLRSRSRIASRDLGSAAAIRRASRTMVGASNRARSGSSTPKLRRAPGRPASASSEWPPRSKKSSCDPSPLDAAGPPPRSRRAAPRRRARRRDRLGPLARPAQAPARARRSSLPLGVSGRAGRTTKRAGTMGSGSALRRTAQLGGRGRAAPSRHHVGDQPLPPSRSATRQHRASRTPGCRASAASISPSSMRKPRTLTWWSSAAEELQLAVRPAARQVAGAVEPRRPGSP